MASLTAARALLPSRATAYSYYGLRWSNDEPSENIPKGGRASMSLNPDQMWNASLLRNEKIIEAARGFEHADQAIPRKQFNSSRPTRRSRSSFISRTRIRTCRCSRHKIQRASPRGLFGDVVEGNSTECGPGLETCAKKKALGEHTGILHERQRAISS
jgi:hypothetical protein